MPAASAERSPWTGRPDAALREGSDYERVLSLCRAVAEHGRRRPTVEALARESGRSEAELRDLVGRWCGLTPEALLEALSRDHAAALLLRAAEALEASGAAYGPPGERAADLAVTREPLSPETFRAGGAGFGFAYGFHPSPFGDAILVASEGRLAGLGFVDDGEREVALADMRRRWPRASFAEGEAGTAELAARIFAPDAWTTDRPVPVILIGTAFEASVWELLLRIPAGRVTTYSAIASRLGRPTASRAVGAAVGKNPISFVVPCHRVVGSGGALTGYYWGVPRKQAMLAWESGLVRRRAGSPAYSVLSSGLR